MLYQQKPRKSTLKSRKQGVFEDMLMKINRKMSLSLTKRK